VRSEGTAILDSVGLAYALPAETVLRQQQVSPAFGLTEQEAAVRLNRHGPNTLLTHPERSAVSVGADADRVKAIGLSATPFPPDSKLDGHHDARLMVDTICYRQV